VPRGGTAGLAAATVDHLDFGGGMMIT